AREAAAEGLAIGDVFAGLVEALLGGAEAHQANQRTAEVKALHHLDKAYPLRTDTVGGRYANAIEKQLGAADRAGAEVLEAIAAEARRMQIDVECTYAPRALLIRPGARHDYRSVGPRAQRDRGFFTVEDVCVAFAARRQLDVGRIGAAPRFGCGERGDNLARADRWKEFAFLPLVAVGRDYRAAQRREQHHVTGIDIGAANLFEGDTGRNVIETLAAIGHRHDRREQAEGAKLADDLPRQVRVKITRGIVRRQFARGKVAQRVAQELLVGVERKFHG